MSLSIHASESENPVSTQNPAIANCLAAFRRAYQNAIDRKADGYDARNKAKLGFREALPPLIGRDNIRNFIACVTYGMAVDLISNGDSARLLQAARTAASVLYQRNRQKAVKNAQQSGEKPPKSGVSRPENPPETNENKQDMSEM